MYSRVMLLEVDTMRMDVDDAATLYEREVVPRLHEQEGFEGVVVLTTPDGKGMIVTFWETEEQAQDASGFAAGELARYTTLFRSPPGREHYTVAYAEVPDVARIG